jgi:eukaryotic-like serine/threonine-protein kinase
VQEWDVPGYTEMKALGSGGSGDVVLARHDASGTLVAIKYMRRHLRSDPQFAELFRGEAEVLAYLDDMNIVRMYEYVECPSGAAIVMELVDGVSLRDILVHQGATTPEAALVVLQGSLLGLAAAHRRGVVHRDYKPENVLVNGDGVSKLTDFGIAARAGDWPVAAGTLVYAPPEQFAGIPASPAGDVYAATATFYECLTGHPPFGGETAEALLYQHLNTPVPLEPVPEALRPLVTAGMAKEPADRPADGTTFVAALETAASGAYGPGWEERGRSHLGEAALLLAALWPSGAPPAVQGSAVERVNLSQEPRDSLESRHLWHVRHFWHLRHVRHLERRRVGPVPAAVVTCAAVALAAAGTALALSGGSPPKLVDSSHTTVHQVSLQPSLFSSNGSSGGSSPGSAPASSSSPSVSQSSGSSSSSPSAPPAVTGVSPASGTTAGGTVVIITGTNLAGATGVSFGGVAGKITADTGTQIIVTSPPGRGTVDITVTTPSGTSSVATADRFTYVAPPPAVTGVSPASGTTAGGTVVAITGTDLAGATRVSFGGVAGKITADTGTQITVTSPPGQGTVDITVTTPSGTSAVATADRFTYVAPPPAVTGVSPASGTTAGGTVVTITGTDLAGATRVSFGGVAGKITADTGTQITVTSPPGQGTVDITVTTPSGTSALTKTDLFAYVSPLQ